MEISNNTFSAAIRKYEKELKTEEAKQSQEANLANSDAIQEYADPQLAPPRCNKILMGIVL